VHPAGLVVVAAEAGMPLYLFELFAVCCHEMFSFHKNNGAAGGIPAGAVACVSVTKHRACQNWQSSCLSKSHDPAS
jgi:hypothetical protein